MSSLTLKGKPSDHAPVASVSSSARTPTSSNASPGMPNDQSLNYFKYDFIVVYSHEYVIKSSPPHFGLLSLKLLINCCFRNSMPKKHSMSSTTQLIFTI